MSNITKEEAIKALEIIQTHIRESLDLNKPLDPAVEEASHDIFVWYAGWKAGYERGKNDSKIQEDNN
jgi:hypothetical protein